MNKQAIIHSLGLEPHPSEGGYFKRIYTSEIEIACAAGTRKILSSIYYLLTDDSPVGYLHRNKSDIVHYFHSGSAITYYIIHPDGQFETQVLGNDLSKGQTPQLTVKGGCWKASELTEGEYGLLSEAVSPGFEYEDMVLANINDIQRYPPKLLRLIKQYLKEAN
ncbi:MAG: cupin domain-containing protein [Gammaproteobacteria bacterium]|nr:cupin domain-containing protein [Gammaproteobacteria bacterium]